MNSDILKTGNCPDKIASCKLERTRVSEADNILGLPFVTLDKGFVRLIDYMGTDSSIVQAARVSYGKGTKTASSDRALIAYLMRKNHTSPFEQVELKFHIKVPMYIGEQILRHRTANVNKISARYSEMEEEFYLPDAARLGKQSTKNKQSTDLENTLNSDEASNMLDLMLKSFSYSYNYYHSLLEKGLSREIARGVLSHALYTEMYWKIDLRNLFHFLKLRLAPPAQLEIQKVAEVIGELTRIVAPIAYSHFEEYIKRPTMIRETDRIDVLVQEMQKRYALAHSSGDEEESAICKDILIMLKAA